MTASMFPFTWASVIMNSAYVLHAKDALDPRATRVSIFGAP